MEILVEPKYYEIFINENLIVGNFPKSSNTPSHILETNLKIDTKEINFIALTVKESDVLEQYDDKILKEDKCLFKIHVEGEK